MIDLTYLFQVDDIFPSIIDNILVYKNTGLVTSEYMLYIKTIVQTNMYYFFKLWYPEFN